MFFQLHTIAAPSTTKVDKPCFFLASSAAEPHDATTGTPLRGS
jgi:hypothetical protein